MGIDITSLEAIILSLKNTNLRGNALTLARQGIHINQSTFNQIFSLHNISLSNNAHSSYCETMFKELGFDNVASIDCSPYENATIIHDMNKPLPENIAKYDYIYDGGTIEHIFNIAQVCENIINFLNVGGVFCSVTCNNNFSGHGIYQFSPEFFMSAFSEEYGMEILSLHIAQVGTLYCDWIDVKSYGNGRNETKFDNTNPVYIIAIARKISEGRKSLIHDSPQQYSYEQIEWKK